MEQSLGGTFPGEATNGYTFDLEGYDSVHASELDHVTSDIALPVKIGCRMLGKEHALVLAHGDGWTTLYVATLSLTEFYGVSFYIYDYGRATRKKKCYERRNPLSREVSPS